MVGKNGETIKRLKSESGCYLGFEGPREKGGDSILVIRGTKEKVDAAEAMAKELLEDAERRLRVTANADADLETDAVMIKIDKDMVSRMIGTRGDNINRIRTQSGCAIELDEVMENEPRLLLRGSDEACAKAKEMIAESIYAYEERDRKDREMAEWNEKMAEGG